MKNKFFKCKWFSYYHGNGLFWFKVLNLGLSFKNILRYEFGKNKEIKGVIFSYWLINIINNNNKIIKK